MKRSIGGPEGFLVDLSGGGLREFGHDADRLGGLVWPLAPADLGERVSPVGNTARQWVDLRHDVTVSDIELSVRENFTAIEHIKRYTTLGMATEQVLDANGHQLGVWMERSHSPHDIAIVNGPNGALHHFAFWLDDWDHVRKSADILAYNGVQIDQGPTRHGVTRGNTIYFFDPLGIRNEVFTGGYRPDPDFPMITWTEDNAGRAIFYYEGELNDRFMKVHT